MLDKEQGIQAIIALQAAAGIDESREDAEKGWDVMSDVDKQKTEVFHITLCGGFGGDGEEKLN